MLLQLFSIIFLVDRRARNNLRLLTHASVASAGNNSVKKEMLPVQISVTTCNMNMYEMHENAPGQWDKAGNEYIKIAGVQKRLSSLDSQHVIVCYVRLCFLSHNGGCFMAGRASRQPNTLCTWDAGLFITSLNVSSIVLQTQGYSFTKRWTICSWNT